MSDVKALEEAVKALAPADLAEFRSWFAEFDFSQWDRRIESDLSAGLLERLMAEAVRDPPPTRRASFEAAGDAAFLALLRSPSTGRRGACHCPGIRIARVPAPALQAASLSGSRMPTTISRQGTCTRPSGRRSTAIHCSSAATSPCTFL